MPRAALRVAVAVLVVVVAHCAVAHGSAIPVVTTPSTAANAYDGGRAIGADRKAVLQSFFATDAATQSLIQYCNGKGAHMCATMLNNSMAAFPDTVHELRGVADGADLPFASVWAANVADEVNLAEGSFPHASACTSVLNTTVGGHTVLGHNEDGGRCLAPPADVYNVAWRVAGGARFFALTYPGTLAGSAFGVNQHGMGFSLNSMFPRTGDLVYGVPNTVLARDLLNAVNVSDALRRLQSYRVATGFTVNVGSVSDPGRMVCVEAAAHGVAVRHVDASAPLFAHFNEYVVLQQPQFPDNSSAHRAATMSRLLAESPQPTIEAVLGNHDDAAYPIYRDGTPPDDCVTLVSAVVDFTAHTMAMYELRNPLAAGLQPTVVAFDDI